jgi:hypothetical protein
MLGRVALVRSDVSVEPSASFIRVTRIGELGTTLAATSNWSTLVFLRSVRRLLVAASVVPSLSILVTLMKAALCSSETSDTILHSHPCENLKSYINDFIRIYGIPQQIFLHKRTLKYRGVVYNFCLKNFKEWGAQPCRAVLGVSSIWVRYC